MKKNPPWLLVIMKSRITKGEFYSKINKENNRIAGKLQEQLKKKMATFKKIS
jgi:hypothetical protein